MKYSINNELEALRADMAMNQLAPDESLIADNQPHEYSICIDGELRKAAYTASPYPFDEDPDGPVLIGWYGLIDERQQYMYSSLKNKK